MIANRDFRVGTFHPDDFGVNIPFDTILTETYMQSVGEINFIHSEYSCISTLIAHDCTVMNTVCTGYIRCSDYRIIFVSWRQRSCSRKSPPTPNNLDNNNNGRWNYCAISRDNFCYLELSKNLFFRTQKIVDNHR